MEFKKIYNDSFSQIHIEIETYIREYLTNEEFSIYDYNTNSNDLLSNFHQEIKTDKFNVVEYFKNLYVEFETFKAKIPNDSIENSFRLKVLPLYNKYRDEKLFDDFSFDYLISEIAIFNAKVNTYRVFSNNYYLLEMIYKSKDYSRYEIKEYNQTLESTDIFKYYHALIYPITNNTPIKPIIKVLEIDLNKTDFNPFENAILIYLFKEIMLEGGFDSDTEIYHTLSLIKVKPSSDFINKRSYSSSIEYKSLKGKVNDIDLIKVKSNNKSKLKELYSILGNISMKIKALKLKNINKKIKEIKNEISPLIS